MKVREPVGRGNVKVPVKLGKVPVNDGRPVGSCASRTSMDDSGGAGMLRDPVWLGRVWVPV